MAEKQLLGEIVRRFMRMPADKRIGKVRSLAGESPQTKDFIRSRFPELYEEAFSRRSSSGDECSESILPSELSAKRR